MLSLAPANVDWKTQDILRGAQENQIPVYGMQFITIAGIDAKIYAIDPFSSRQMIRLDSIQQGQHNC